MNFKFDKEKAIKADTGGGITKTGVYIGVFKRAEFGKKESGAKYIEFEFEEKGTGAKANFLQIYLVNKDGSENFNAAKLHSCLGILGVTEAPIVKLGDVQTLPAVCGKPIGLIIEREDYKNVANESKYKFDILHFIDAKTFQTYSEIEAMVLPAKVYEKFIVTEISKPGVVTAVATTYKKPSEQQNGGQKDDDGNDDLPF